METEYRIIGHRGSGTGVHHSGLKENTRASVALAFQQGADEVEIDVALTQDGQIVLYHDPVLSVSRRSLHHTSLAQAREEDADISLLADVMNDHPEKYYVLELKSYTPFREILDILAARYADWSHIRFISFNQEALMYARQLRSDAYCNFIATCLDERFEPFVKPAHLDWCREMKIDEVSGHWWLFTKSMVLKAREVLPVGLGMIDSRQRLNKCIGLGVRRLYTNRVEQLVSWVRPQ